MHRSRFRQLCLVALLTAAAPAAFAQGASLETATAAQKDAATKAFVKGSKASAAGKHEEALSAFKESYDAVASPNSHLMYARELVALERFVDAYESYEKIIVEAEAAAKLDAKYAQSGEAAKKEMTDLEAKIGLLTVNVKGSPGDIVRVGGKELPETKWGKPLPLMPGSVRVELVTSSGKEVSEEVALGAGQRTSVELDSNAPAAGGPPPDAGPADQGGSVSTDSSTWDKRTWAYVAGGIGVAGIVTFGVFGALNNSKHGKLEDECSGGVCPKSLESDRDSGKTYQTVANVGLVVGIVGLGTGTALYLMSGDSTEKKASKQPRKSRVQVGVGYQAVTVHGTF